MPRGIPKSGFRKTKNYMKNSGTNVGGSSTPKIKILPTHFIESLETDEEIRSKLKERFSAMTKMAHATISGINKTLIISGPAGLGKSYGVLKVAAELERKNRTVVIIKGKVRATGLYKVLYENRHAHCTVVFDDADGVFGDDDSLGLLKAACDMTRKRTLHWLAETNMEDEDGEKVPTKFDFEGSVIFITNMDFDYHIAKDSRFSPHFEAMISRSIYLDLAMKSKRDYMMRIHMVIEEGMLKQAGLSEKEASELVEFLDKNFASLRELSLRMVVKIANLMRMDRADWKNLARVTCFRQ